MFKVDILASILISSTLTLNKSIIVFSIPFLFSVRSFAQIKKLFGYYYDNVVLPKDLQHRKNKSGLWIY